RLRAAPFIALMEHVERARLNVEPRDRDVCAVPDLEVHSPQLEEIRRRRNADVEVETLVQSADHLTVERPVTLGGPLHPQIKPLLADPTEHDTVPGTPFRIAVDDVGN